MNRKEARPAARVAAVAGTVCVCVCVRAVYIVTSVCLRGHRSKRPPPEASDEVMLITPDHYCITVVITQRLPVNTNVSLQRSDGGERGVQEGAGVGEYMGGQGGRFVDGLWP